MLRLRDISEDTALFPWNQSTPYPAVASTIAVGIALLLGQVTGHRSAGSIAAGAAFTVGFAAFHEALSSTLLSMAVLTVGIASATLAGSLGAHWTPLVLLLCVVAAINYGLLAGIDNTAGWIGQQCAIFVIISSYFANGVHFALGRTAMVLAGGTLQMLVYALTRTLHRRSDPQPPAPPFTQQLRARGLQLWDCIRTELRGHSTSTSYVLRLMITLLISTAVYRALHWSNGYWAPMTALLVLKPKWANTLSRGIARLAGTLVGAGICAVLARYAAGFPHSVYFGLIVITAFGCFALQAVNYALFSSVLTMYTVFLFAFGGFSERYAADLRLINTALGGILALLVDFIASRLAPHFRRDTPAAPNPIAAAVKRVAPPSLPAQRG